MCDSVLYLLILSSHQLSAKLPLQTERSFKLNIFPSQFFRQLQAIEKERLPQVLAIHHGDEDEEEEEEFGGFRSNSSDEIQEEGKHCDSRDAAPPDSSSQCPSTGEYSLSTSGQGYVWFAHNMILRVWTLTEMFHFLVFVIRPASARSLIPRRDPAVVILRRHAVPFSSSLCRCRSC